MTNPWEMLGEKIQSLGHISQEIEKMPEAYAARFFDVEYASESTHGVVDGIFGRIEPIEPVARTEAAAAVVELANQNNASPNHSPMLSLVPSEIVSSEEIPELNMTQHRNYIDQIYKNAA